MPNRLLTDNQVRVLLLQLAKGQNEFLEPDAAVVIGWANDVLLAKDLLEMVLCQELTVCVRDGKVYFRRDDDDRQRNPANQQAAS